MKNDTTNDAPSGSLTRSTISLCMIVKNEEGVLRECLSSVHGLVDEMIIVDTGSTDRTIDVAREFKAKISSILWADDFSAAKNAAIRRATKQWILWLDADEVLPASEHEKVRQAIAAADNPKIDNPKSSIEGYRTPIKNFITIEKNEMASGAVPLVSSPDTAMAEAKGANAYFVSTTIRLFRNHKDLYFVGRVHELLNKDKDTGVIATSDLTIHHSGYLRHGARREEKKELYLRLGKEKAEQEKTPEAQVELSALYADRGQLHHAKACLQKAIQLKPNVPEWHYNLAVLHKKLGEYGKAEEALRKAIFLDEKTTAIYLNPDPYPFIFASLGELFMRQRRYDDALFMLAKARKSHPNRDVIDHAIQQCYLLQRRMQRRSTAVQGAMQDAMQSAMPGKIMQGKRSGP
ncbi:glycosyltransferase [Candidatus Woesearchaeota archaeon]|nr:glycosyltransferase [Candidatus Woesearchaeota archaeon]